MLPPEIGFDISSEVQLPEAKASFLCDNAGAEIVRQFLEQYFILYDSDNRQQLLDAYHEHAMLSLTCTNNQHPTAAQRLHAYYNFNRNLCRVKDSEGRFKSLRRGRLQVVTLLSELPLTKHDPMSFAVDLTLFTVSHDFSGKFLNLETNKILFAATNDSAHSNWSLQRKKQGANQQFCQIIPKNALHCTE